MKVLLLLLIFIANVVAGVGRVELCEDVGERVIESSVLEDYRGRSVVLAFSGTYCQECATRLLRFVFKLFLIPLYLGYH